MMAKVGSVPEIVASLQQYIAKEILADGIACAVDVPLAQLGVDSAALLSVLLFIERRFEVIVPDAELNRSNLASLNALAACVHRLAAAASPG